MCKCMNIPYSGKSFEFYNKIKGTLNPYTVNQLYINTNLEKEVCFLINGKGYMHIFISEKCKVFGEIQFRVTDFLLTKENILKDTGKWKYYKTREECRAFFNNAIKY